MTREEAIVELENMKKFNYTLAPIEVFNMAISALEQEPKTGRWISHYDEDAKEGWYECDRCHTERAFNTKFCPDCGAKMIEPQESEEE